MKCPLCLNSCVYGDPECKKCGHKFATIADLYRSLLEDRQNRAAVKKRKYLPITASILLLIIIQCTDGIGKDPILSIVWAAAIGFVVALFQWGIPWLFNKGLPITAKYFGKLVRSFKEGIQQ